MTKYESKTEEGKCIFCEIVNGKMETPGIFWEDDEFLAFLSIFPNMVGVTAVMPKEHFGSDVLKMPDDKLCRFILAAKKVANILLEHFDDVGRVGLVMEGTGIDHAHIKLYPMHGTENMKTGEWKQFPSGVDTFFEKYPGYICSNDSLRANDEEIKNLVAELKKIVEKK
jgi:diadenosine tetraphosphate (Ap4A) HIT family hydrolase